MKIRIVDLNKNEKYSDFLVKNRGGKNMLCKNIPGIGIFDLCILRDEMQVPIENLEEALRIWDGLSDSEKDNMIEQFFNPYDKSKSKSLKKDTVDWFLHEIILKQINKKSLVSNIRKMRESAGLTQQQFADLFGISIDTVKSWDCGRRKPDKLKEKLIIEKLEIIKNETMKKATSQ